MNTNTEDFFNSFPKIYVELGNEILIWKPEEYLIADIVTKDNYCIGIDSQV